MATERQIEANRRNATLSTGPKTEEGKAASRANATRHGLASESTEVELGLSEAFEARRKDWAAHYRPTGPLESWKLDRAVVASLRIERCERAMEAVLESAEARAVLHWDEDRAREASQTASKLPRNPALYARKLRADRQGTLILIDWWGRLDAILTGGEEWTEEQSSLAMDMLGVPRCLRSGGRPIDPPDGTSPLLFRRELIEREVNGLRALLSDGLVVLDTIERDQAVEGVTNLMTPEARLVLRYEREAWRRYRESVRDLGTGEPSEAPPAATPAPTRDPAPAPAVISVESAEELDEPDSDFDPEDLSIEPEEITARVREEFARAMRGLGLEADLDWDMELPIDPTDPTERSQSGRSAGLDQLTSRVSLARR